jgi:hypothetical protein
MHSHCSVAQKQVTTAQFASVRCPPAQGRRFVWGVRRRPASSAERSSAVCVGVSASIRRPCSSVGSPRASRGGGGSVRATLSCEQLVAAAATSSNEEPAARRWGKRIVSTAQRDDVVGLRGVRLGDVLISRCIGGRV